MLKTRSRKWTDGFWMDASSECKWPDTDGRLRRSVAVAVKEEVAVDGTIEVVVGKSSKVFRGPLYSFYFPNRFVTNNSVFLAVLAHAIEEATEAETAVVEVVLAAQTRKAAREATANRREEEKARDRKVPFAVHAVKLQ